MKRGKLTYISGAHGVQSNEIHGIHKVRGDQRRQERKKAVFIRLAVENPENEYPPFRSDVSKLGGGQNFSVEKKNGVMSLITLSGERWLEKLMEARLEYSWYHQLQVRKGKPGYYRRELKDREKMSPTDTHKREPSDVLRETIDLRPDHSRMIQYLLASDKIETVKQILDEVRAKKVELFEQIYAGRRVLYVGEHDDAGQHHDDLWHCGIVEHPTEKAGRGKKQPRRDRVPFCAYGVGVGAASFWRHFSALEESGMSREEIKKLAAMTVVALEIDKENATIQNKEAPRDLRLLESLDQFVAEKLQALDTTLYLKARSEYVDWIRVGYETGKLGVQKKDSLQLLSSRVNELESEVKGLRMLKEALIEFFDTLSKEKGLIQGVLKLGPATKRLLKKLGKMVGFDFGIRPSKKDVEQSISGPS